MNRPQIRRPRLALVMHCARVGLVVALLLAIPSPTSQSVADGSVAPDFQRVRAVMPTASAIDDQPDTAGMWSVLDNDDRPIAKVARTLPIAQAVVGYRGPTESMIVLNPDLTVAAVELLQSTDTQEHVDAVLADESFFQQFQGWPWGGPTGDTKIDAVSGATLTSLALAAGVLKRIGGDRPSLIFPEPIAADEVAAWYDDVESIDQTTTIAAAKNKAGSVIGHVLRTGPLTDDIAGYQGPTEMLLKLSADGQVVQKIRLRRSFDNEPYVDYVRVEAGFWAIFAGKTLTQLAALDPQAAGIEGVSGATMTSLAVADTIVAAAGAAIDAEAATSNQASRFAMFRWSKADLATISLLLLAALASRRRWFHARLFRRVWLISVIVVIGLWAGNLISFALIAGWSAEGIAWRLAPGLAAIAMVAMIAPPLTKGNPYCNHLCPHGAIQQLIKPSATSRRHKHPSRRATAWLTRIPAATLIVAYLTLVMIPSTDLSAWEPFHAYLFRIAPWGAFALAIGTLVIAAFVPMGYCRFGCPTGSLLGYLRRTARSDRLQTSDIVAAGLLLTAWCIR